MRDPHECTKDLPKLTSAVLSKLDLEGDMLVEI